jgi:hypothetical protein
MIVSFVSERNLSAQTKRHGHEDPDGKTFAVVCRSTGARRHVRTLDG